MSESQLPEMPAWPNFEEPPLPDSKSRMPPPVLIGVVVAAVIMAAVFGLVIIRSLLNRDGQSPTLDPTIMSEYVAPPSDVIMIDGGTPRPQANFPISMTIKGLEFSILPYQVQTDGEWHYPAGQSGTAVWVYGTIVNYVVGIEQTKANVAILEGLSDGDEITLATSSGLIYHFGFAGRDQLTVSSSDLFAQTQPGLTLVSLGGKQSRLVVYGEYLMTKERGEDEQPVGLSVGVGEPAQLGDVRVTVLGTSYVYEGDNVPEGWAYFLVDYQIENFSQENLDPNRLRMELQDGGGNTYSLNLPASQVGTFGFLMLTVPPNTVAQGTAGYLVPAPLVGPRLGWSFSRLDVPEAVAKVLIDFESPQDVLDPRQLAAVNLSGAELSGDRTVLSVWGTVLNNSDEVLQVSMQDVSLIAAGVTMSQRAADPALPWLIDPGAALSFRLSFQRPGSSVATFSVLEQPFEISGLQ